LLLAFLLGSAHSNRIWSLPGQKEGRKEAREMTGAQDLQTPSLDPEPWKDSRLPGSSWAWYVKQLSVAQETLIKCKLSNH
jgi:hypothetical protein